MRQFRDVVLERLRVAPFSDTDVFDTECAVDGVPIPYESRPRRYLVVFTGRDAVPSDRLAGPQTDIDMRFTVRAVGKSVSEVLFAAEHASAMLMNARLSVPGRNSRPVRHASSDPMAKDSSVGDGLFFLDDEYSWVSFPG